ncbi:unnamed protein product [Arabis nemorensis]|uniref:Zinc knuckle CX2CX4HX4C domain-containing protein n=1 Tax=Arabis nemorensis TaxID=586526 RepID=A0A565CEQ0_9BRAS|nr:unnamed protein product [Arabis nemorensis]
MGHVDEVRIVEPAMHLKKPAEIWVRVTMDIDSEISLVRNVQTMHSSKPIEREFKYEKLQKFCSTCGSMRHSYDACPKASTPNDTAGALMEIGNDPFITAQERRAAIEGLNTGQDLGESSGAAQPIPLMLAPISDYLMEHGFGQNPISSDAETIVGVRDVDMEGADHITKRKMDELELTEEMPAPKKTFGKDKSDKEEREASSSKQQTDGLSGGLAIFWDPHIQLIFVNTPSLYQTDMKWKSMIAQVEAGHYNHMPRLVLGDFNDVKFPHEKEGGAYRS